jgi:hypothetical protein
VRGLSMSGCDLPIPRRERDHASAEPRPGSG